MLAVTRLAAHRPLPRPHWRRGDPRGDATYRWPPSPADIGDRTPRTRLRDRYFRQMAPRCGPRLRPAALRVRHALRLPRRLRRLLLAHLLLGGPQPDS